MLSKLFKKRVPTALLAIFALSFSLAGCTTKKDETLSVMIPLQKESFKNFFDLFSSKNSDVEFSMSAYRGGSPSAYIYRCFEMNDLSDIVITSYPPEAEIQENTLLDLSGHNFVQNYKASVLSNLDVNGSIYLLECPSSVRGIAYNKTMFEDKGWEVPTSHEEFIQLLKDIRDDGSVVPLGLQGKYPGTYFTLMSELSYCDFLQTPDGAEWMRKFAKGEAKAEDGFKYGMDLLKDWYDAGAFNDDQLSLGDSALYEKFVTDKWCAMSYVMGSQNKLVDMVENSSDEFGMFPIYGTGADSEFVATTHGLKVGINKRLGEPGNKKKLQKALRIMEFLSTEEGQMVFHTGRGDILPLVGSTTSLSSLFSDITGVMDRGHCAPFLYSGYEDILASAGEYLRKAFYNDEDSVDDVFGKMDGWRADSLANKSNYIATVSETLDEDQVAQYVANALNAQEYGDFALVSQGRYSEHFDLAGGANGKLFKGGINTLDINIPITNMNAQSCVVMTLTGSEVMDLLEKGRVLKDDQGHEDSYVYFGSGINIERNADGSLKSATYKGEPLDASTEYKVVFSPQDYSAECVEIGNPQETGVAWQDAYLAYVTKLGTITPEHAQKQ